MELNNESKTLFIPLFSRALMSRKNLFLTDKKAEEIIDSIDFDFKKFKQSKWLSMFLAVRTVIIDELCNKYISSYKDLTIIHLGCGLDSRNLRVNPKYSKWYDVDYEEVIDLRRKFYQETDCYKMIGSSVLEDKWLDKISDTKNVLVVAEGLTMYLSEDEISNLLTKLKNKFEEIILVFDFYSKKGVSLSKIKNPVNKMNANIKYGIDKYSEFLKLDSGLKHINTHLIKRDDNSLVGLEKIIFNHLYCGRISQGIYKIYEFYLKNT